MSGGHDEGEERGTSSRIQYEERDGIATVYNWYTREQTEALLPRGTEWGIRVFAEGPPINIQVSATLRAAPEAPPPILSRTTLGTTSSPPAIATPRMADLIAHPDRRSRILCERCEKANVDEGDRRGHQSILSLPSAPNVAGWGWGANSSSSCFGFLPFPTFFAFPSMNLKTPKFSSRT